MEESYKRHGKKADQETQSPVIKVFKDMMQKEKDDPEKANLLKEKKEKKKRRQYSGSRLKSEQHNQRSRDSSSSEYIKRSIQYKVTTDGQKTREYEPGRPQNMPSPDGKKGRRWFWDTQKKPAQDKKSLEDPKPSVDTNSCVSCALKKVLSSEYACMACLGVLFLISILVAFFVVFRNGNIIARSEREVHRKPNKLNSELLKRKIEMLEGAKANEDSSLGANERPWDGVMPRRLGGMSGLVGNGYGDDNFRESVAPAVPMVPLNISAKALDVENAVQDAGLKSESELASILNPENFNEGASSDRLRNFYKKLVQTDAQIRAMKKEINDASRTTPYNDKYHIMADRRKRSLRLARTLKTHHLPKRSENTKVDEKLESPALNTTQKSKRHANDTEVPIGLIMEQKEILVQYKPNGARKVPKCSHVPKDSKSHEKHMKHPFYKNTQRLDELLDQYLGKSLPETIEHPFSIETLLKEDSKDTSPHDDLNDQSIKNTKSYFTPFKPSNELDKELFDFLSNKKKSESPVSSSPNYNVRLSDSNPGNPSNEIATAYPVAELSHLRKLMQVNEEDENLGYEDVNEVLADEHETDHEMEKHHDRKKRYDDHVNDDDVPNTPFTAKPVSGIHNPNWKGPMPFYPDELISMIKQAAMENIHNFNKASTPNSDKEALIGVDDSAFNDMDYVENYSDKKFNKLAQMAQAYSDYGVFNEKKNYLTTGKTPVADVKQSERKVKSVNKAKAKKHSFFDRFKKGSNSGGVKLEIGPGISSKNDARFSMFKALGKHVRFGKPEPSSMDRLHNALVHSTPAAASPDFAMFSSIHSDTKYYTNVPENNAKEFALNFGKGNARTLLSIPENNNYDYESDLNIKKTNVDKINSANNYSNENYIEPPNGTVSKITDFNVTNEAGNKNVTALDLSDFFMMMSNWFSALALSGDNLKTGNSTNTNISLTTQKSSVAIEDNKTVVMYPNYDADMIENIGHRSRVLMSIEDKEHSSSVTPTKEPNDNKSITPTDGKVLKLAAVILTTPKYNTTTEAGFSLAVTIFNKSIAATDNKTVVKRNAVGNSNDVDSNLVLWNDIYDDEYGIKMDPVHDPVGDTQSARGVDFVKKSGSWIQNKFRSFANNMRGKDKSVKEVTKKMNARAQRYLRADAYPRYQHKTFYKRNAHNDKENSNVNQDVDDPEEENSNFDSLTAKMKVVCKEAAKAVEQTRNIQVRQDEKEDTITTSLMQQLVRLMRDLVDFQVQQKTCLHLPSDLQQFLEWLTTGNTAKIDDKPHTLDVREGDSDLQLNTELSTERVDIQYNNRFDYILPLHAVEELLQQYDEMDDDEKAKLTGVKEYLENQSQFLNKQLSNMDDYKIPNLYEIKDLTSRFRRDLSDMPKFRTIRRNNPRKRFKRVFLRNFGRKHTRTTASVADVISTTEINRSYNINVTATEKDRVEFKDKDNKTLDARNVEAVDDSEKHTTCKDEKEPNGFDNAQIVKIEK